ncbi:MAG: LOG family protein [bacterium]|nr:LOG family protein [bacterium]
MKKSKKDDTRLKAFENSEFLTSREARTLRILSEYLEPEKRFEEQNVLHTVAFFGSARTLPDGNDPKNTKKYYHAAEDFAYQLGLLSKEIEKKLGNSFSICTGGGPGIMEAANKGAERAGAASIGLNIELPFEQESNPYITPELNFEFHYFFMRKLWFLYYAKALVIFPGGFGTFDELFEILTLVQTHKLEKKNLPILLYDKEFWTDLINFNKLVDYGLISPEDLDLFHFFSSSEEGIKILKPSLISAIENLKHYHNI